MENRNNTNVNQIEKEHQGNKSPSNKTTSGFFNYIFRRSKTEDNPGFINRQMPAYWYDGKS